MLNFVKNRNTFLKYNIKKFIQINVFDIALITFLSGIASYIFALKYSILTGTLNQAILIVIYLLSASIISFYFIRSKWLNLLASIFLLFVCSMLSSIIIDLGADSQTAHINSYMSILNGWDISSLERVKYQIYGINFETDNYQNYLAGRVPYILFAISYSLTGFLDSGKGINLAFHISSAIIFFNLLPLKKSKTRLLITSLIFMNPASVAQLNTHYIDHFIFIGFLLCTLTAIKITFYANNLRSDHEQKYICAILFASSVLLSGSKLPGVVFNIALVFGICSFFLLQRKHEYRRILLVIGFSGLGSIIGGMFPYLTGLDFSNSQGVVSIIDNIRSTSLAWESQSAWLNDTNTLQRLVHSIFSEYNGNPSKVPSYKLPGWIKINELSEIAKVHPDARIGGFGPLFSFSLCLSIIIMAYGLYINRMQYTKCVCLFILIFLTCTLHPYSFWARWAPQIWILPVIVLLWHQNSDDRIIKKLEVFLAFSIVTNIVLFSSIHFLNSVYLQKKEQEELQILIEFSKNRENNSEANLIWFQNFHAWKFRLEEYNIKYQVYDGPLSEFDCLPENYGKLNRSQVVYCKDG